MIAVKSVPRSGEAALAGRESVARQVGEVAGPLLRRQTPGSDRRDLAVDALRELIGIGEMAVWREARRVRQEQAFRPVRALERRGSVAHGDLVFPAEFDHRLERPAAAIEGLPRNAGLLPRLMSRGGFG